MGSTVAPLRVLIIEDDREVAGFLRRGLEEEGYFVTVAYDGGEGLRNALTAANDILILDVPFSKGV